MKGGGRPNIKDDRGSQRRHPAGKRRNNRAGGVVIRGNREAPRCLQGLPDQAMRTAERCVADARTTNHAISLGRALSVAACPIALWAGDLAAAEYYVRRRIVGWRDLLSEARNQRVSVSGSVNPRTVSIDQNPASKSCRRAEDEWRAAAALSAATVEAPKQHQGPLTDQTPDQPRTWLGRLLDSRPRHA